MAAVPLQPYAHVLRRPGVVGSVALMFLARLPMTAMGITMTLHVVSTLERGYGAAGLAGAITTGGTAVGAPLVGRTIDRFGLRPVIAMCSGASAMYWLIAPHLPYHVLLVCALPAGLLTLPASSVARQILAALVTPEQRRTAFSLDSMSLELTFMIGPAIGVAIATQVSSTAALSAIGCTFAVAGATLWLTNPPVRNSDEVSAGERRPPMRSWLGRRLFAMYLAAFGALFVLIGAEVSALAALRSTGDVSWTGLVIAVMCAASLIGGLVHGAVHRSLPPTVLVLLLGFLTVPVAIAFHPWWLLALLLIPSNLVCAPSLAAATEATSRLAPARVRGEAMGLQATATQLGLAAGQPIIGFVLDHSGPAWGFVVAGLVGAGIAGAAMLLARSGQPSPVRV